MVSKHRLVRLRLTLSELTGTTNTKGEELGVVVVGCLWVFFHSL